MDFSETKDEQINEKSKQKEKYKDNEDSEQQKIKNILPEYSELIPLKLVDTIERLYHTILSKTIYGSLNTLSSYKESHNREFNLIDFELKTQNSTKILRKMNEINCVKVTTDTLFTGEKTGYVYMYQIEKGLELEGFGQNGFNSPVSAIENKGNEYLLVGYENGTINLFDIKKVVLIKSINNIHKTRIIALKFVSIEKSGFQIISTDEEGQVMFINSSNTMLNKKTIGNIIYKESEPTYAITKFKPYENKKLTFLVFASTNKVFVYTLEPKLNSISEIKKPKYAEKNDIPDISLGWGVHPVPLSQKKSEKKRDREILLAVGWGNVITLYGFLNKGDNYRLDGPIGFFQNNHPITKLGFFSSSIIYFFDKTSQIKALNTAFFNFGKFEDNIIYENKKTLIDEGEKFKNMKFNIISKDDKKYTYYRNFIYNMKKHIYLFSGEGLRIGNILSYKECIDNIIKNSNNWNSALCLAIDIYKGNHNNIMGVPLDEEERKKTLRPYMIQILNRYIDYNFNTKKDFNSEEDILSSSKDNDNISEIKAEKIIECINVAIEFCIEIKEIDYLLKDVETTFASYGKADSFYKLLEHFIFNDLLLKEDLDAASLTSLYGAYKIKDELVLLSHLFTHLNIKCLNNFMVKKLAIKDNLFNLIIFIFSNGDCSEDFFFPISKMFSVYSKVVQNENVNKEGNEIEKNNDDKNKNYSFYDSFIKKGIKGINEMEKCREYIGHKLLWYIEMSLKGNKYASGIEVELLKFETNSENYKKFISYIYFWILQEKIFKNLLEFDSYSLFSVLSLFFTEPKIKKIIQNYDFSTINAELIENLIKEQENNTYFMRTMKGSFNTVFTMVEGKKADNKIDDTLKPSLTIMPRKVNINSIQENDKKEIIENNEKKKEEELVDNSKEVLKENNETEKEQKEIPKEKFKDKEINKETPKEETLKEEEISKEEVKEKDKETPKEEKESKEKKQKLEDPFATSKNGTEFGKGVKLNDLNSILEYIFKIVNSQPNDLSHLDLDVFLVKYASKCPESIPQKIRAQILKGIEDLLNFFSENKRIRKDLIAQNKDKFNIHNLNKKSLDTQDSYFINVSNLLLDLLNSKIYQFTKDELYNLKTAASGTKFTKIKIKIEELSKKFKECLDIFIKEENSKLREKVFSWMEEKFQFYIEEINEEKKKEILDSKLIDSKLNLLIKDYEAFIDAIIDKIYDLAKMRIDKTKKIVGKYFTNTEKLKVYYKLEKDSQIQFEFLEQLLYQPIEQMNEEGTLNDNIIDEQQQNENIDLFKLYVNNKKESDTHKDEKKIREEFDKLILDQIHLLMVLKRKSDILTYLKKNIKLYPNYPLREALKECIENSITDSAVYIFQTLGENRQALYLTKENLEKAFKGYLRNSSNNKDFLEKLQICTNICRENSESLMKKINVDKDKKEPYNEGEELWFDLLKTLYEFEDKLENKENNEIEETDKKLIQNTLQKGVEDLLKQMCLYVSIQNLVKNVTEYQGRAQYKEFKTILESMLRFNTSFDRVLHSVMAILRDSIENSESKRKKVTSKGNNYNYKRCDVCNKLYENSKEEVIYCFGCGHQSHEKCCHKKKLKNEKENRITLNEEEEDELNYIIECEVCRKNKIENRNKWENEDENLGDIEKIKDEETEGIKIEAPSNKVKSFKFGNKRDKLKKIDRYDRSYQNEVSMFF